MDYVADSEALQYHESLEMSDADFEFIERTVESVTGGDGDSVGED